MPVITPGLKYIAPMIVYGVLAALTTVSAQQAGNALELSRADAAYSLAGHFYYYEDKMGELTLDKVSAPAFADHFILVPTGNLNLGYTDSVIWLRFDLRNLAPQVDDWLLEFDYPLLDRIEVYAPDRTFIMGDMLPFAARPLPHRTFLVPLTFNGDRVNRYYVRISSQSSMQIRPSIHSGLRFFRRSNQAEILYGLLYGVMLMMALYNSFLFLALRDPTYLAYVFAVLSGMVFLMALNGHGYQYLWPTHPALANTIIPLSSSLWLIGTAIFTMLFLETRRYAPLLSRVLAVLIGVGAFAVLLSLTAGYRLAIRVSTAAALINGLLLLITGAVCWRRGNRSARFFTTAWIVYGGGTALLVLSRFSLMPDNFITLNAAGFGLVVEVILLSLALSDKYRMLTEQLESYSKELENKVAERTVELEKANETLRQLSIRDPLTHLANRRRFDEYLDQEWRRHQRDRQPLALLMCDVDHFKRYNDHYGHQAGDDCLRSVAEALKKAAQRPADLVARYGGEEFALILPETEGEGAVEVAEHIRSELHKLAIPHAASETDATVTLSIGVASLVPAQEQTPQMLIQAADEALYEAKRQGRNRVVANYQHAETAL